MQPNKGLFSMINNAVLCNAKKNILDENANSERSPGTTRVPRDRQLAENETRSSLLRRLASLLVVLETVLLC